MSANAIERIRDALDGGVPLLYREDRMARRAKAEDALAAVEALLEAAKAAEAHLPEQPNKAKRLLTVAVRRVETGQ